MERIARPEPQESFYFTYSSGEGLAQIENENWELAAFEINEIKENLEDIEKYQSERTESKSLSMLTPVLDSLATAIKQKNFRQI